MKSYNGLWDQTMTTKNIVESIENAHRGKGKKLKKKHYKLLVWLYKHRFEEKTQNLVRKWIYDTANVYNPNRYKPPIEIKDGSSGKIRHIYVPTVKELVVQHCVVNVLKKILLPMLGSQTYGSIPGKGSQKAVRKMMEFIREHPEQCKYCVKMVAKANEIAKARHITLGQRRSMFSYNGYLKVTKTHNVYLKFIKSKISFKYLRKRISAYDRRINGMENCSRNSGRKAEAA